MFGNKKKKILAEGAQAQAIVINVHDTGVTINDNPRVKLTLQVQPEGQMPFEATKKVTVSRVAIPRVGDQYLVRYDPSDPSNVEFDTAALAQANQAAEAAMMQAAAAQVPADLMTTGILGRGALVDVQKTPTGQLVSCVITAGVRLVDGTPSYRATAQISLTPENAERLIPGQTLFTVRADPNNHQRIAISLAEQTPSVVITDPAVTDPPARALREGTPCQVQIVAHAEQFLRLPTGEDLFATKVRVVDDGSEFQVYVPVPPAAMSRFTDGATLPAKRILSEPNVLAVDWAAAGVASGAAGVPA
jgi:hypothetical protein